MNKNYEYLNKAHAESALDHQREIIFKELLTVVSSLLDRGYNPITIAEELGNRCGMLACISSASSNYTKPMAINVLRTILNGVTNEMVEKYDDLKKELEETIKPKLKEEDEDSIYNPTYWKP